MITVALWRKLNGPFSRDVINRRQHFASILQVFCILKYQVFCKYVLHCKSRFWSRMKNIFTSWRGFSSGAGGAHNVDRPVAVGSDRLQVLPSLVWGFAFACTDAGNCNSLNADVPYFPDPSPHSIFSFTWNFFFFLAFVGKEEREQGVEKWISFSTKQRRKKERNEAGC